MGAVARVTAPFSFLDGARVSPRLMALYSPPMTHHVRRLALVVMALLATVVSGADKPFDARKEGVKVYALCTFVNAERKKHPDWTDVFQE